MQDPLFKKLSDRALNVLILNKLDNAYLLIEHFKREGHFLSLRQCGPVTNQKIVDFCEEIMNDAESQRAEQTDSDSTTVGANDESTKQSEETEYLELPEFEEAEIKFLEMSDRARNTLLRNGIVGFKSLVEYYKQHKSFNQLNHCGPVTSDELAEFCENIIENY